MARCWLNLFNKGKVRHFCPTYPNTRPEIVNFKQHLGDRIRDLRTDKGLTQDELADRIGKKKNHVSHYESGRNAPQVETLALIAAALSTTTDYLLTGAEPSESNRVRAAVFDKEFGEIDQTHLYPQFVPPDTDTVPLNRVSEQIVNYNSGTHNYLVPIRAQAGLGFDFGTEVLDEDLKPLVIPGVDYAAYTFEVEGDSMEPLLFEGDYVVCKRVQETSDLNHDAIYLVITRSSGVYIKLFKALSDSQFVFASTNTKYKDTRLDHDDVREIWEATVRLSFHIKADGMPSSEIKRFQQLEDFIKQKFPDYKSD